MSDPVLTHEQFTRGLGGFQVIFGLLMVVIAIRSRSRFTRVQGPIGTLWFAVGLGQLLHGFVAENVLIALTVALAAVAIAWRLRDRRGYRAHDAALLHSQRDERIDA